MACAYTNPSSPVACGKHAFSLARLHATLLRALLPALLALLVLLALLALLALPATLGLSPALAAGPDIVIGQSIDLTGKGAAHGTAVNKGARAYIDSINEKGGVHGQKIVLMALSDEGKSKLAAENARKLIQQHGAVALFGGVGGGACVAATEAASELKVPLIACMGGSPGLRDPFNRYSFPLRPGHDVEFMKMAQMARLYGLDKVAFLRDAGKNGERHLANMKKATEQNQLDLMLDIAVETDESKWNPRQIAATILEKKPKAVFNQTHYSLYGEVIREVRKHDSTIQFYASNSGAQQMVEKFGTAIKGLIFTQVVPSPSNAVIPVVKEYRSAFSRHFPKEPYSYSSLEGYLSAKFLVEGMKRAGPRPTPEKLVAAFESIVDHDLGGVIASYGPTSRKGSVYVDTVIVTSQGKFMN